MENEIVKREDNPVKEFFADKFVVQKFNDVIGSKAQPFITALLQVVAGNDSLRTCSPKSIFNAAMTAATLDLPVNQNLGFAWIIPYREFAQFQMGYKGFVQLAMRTGQYLKLNVVAVHKNQFVSWNDLTEDLSADFTKPGDGNIVGYCGYFKMVNGFEKFVFWTVEKIQGHAMKYSKNFNNNNSIWKTDFHSMAEKTVLKSMLSKWGILSVELQKAIQLDQAIIENAEGTKFSYIDNSDTPDEKTNAKSAAAIGETVNLLDSKRK